MLTVTCMVAFSACSNFASKSAATETKAVEKTVYTCPMHNEIRSKIPGDCPKCGMELVKMDATDTMHEHADTMLINK